MNDEIVAYKLLTLRKDGTLGPLFINKGQVLEVGVSYDAEDHPTKGYARRPGWHATARPEAPHMSMKGRVWAEVLLEGATPHQRPESQGGRWYVAKRMTVTRLMLGHFHPNRFDCNG